MITSSRPRRVTALAALSGAMLFSVSERNASGEDLKRLIPGLWGGDGITLATDTPHVAHFARESGDQLQQLNERLATSFGRFPVNSSAGNFALVFDSDLGTFVNTTESLGPIFAERAPTIGKGKWSLNFYGTFFSYDTFEGRDMDDLHVMALHDADSTGFDPDPTPGTRGGFELDTLDMRVNVDAAVRIFSPAVTYGVTDRFDVSLLLPIVHVDMDVVGDYRLITSPLNPRPDAHNVDPAHGAEPSRSRRSEDATGIGDLVVGAKYLLYTGGPVDLAGAFLAQFATGDEDNFLGTGDHLVRPFLVASRTFRSVGGTALNLTPHVNLGYQYNVNYADRSALEYVVGFDAGVRRVTLATDLLGSVNHHGDDILDFAVGLKVNPYKRLVFSGNVILPLNDTGLRSDVITTLGVGVTF